ncbi:MAG: SMC-Scp complex subunit ScpB [Candidatus Omnitrophica bacterium]|nr:SMC-Scp complex subunit ScpB [Candidatus Omnitrophota bacterium]
MDGQEAKRVIEALLFVFGQPVSLKRLSEVLPDVESAAIRGLIGTLNADYRSSSRAFYIQEVAGGYQMVTDEHLALWITRALQTPKPDSVSAAALETLAIIAYRQPITKAEIEAIRGVDVAASLETLMERRFIRAAGRKDSPGRPFLYATTPEFLRHFGLKSLEALPHLELPTLKEPESADAGPSDPAAAAQPVQANEVAVHTALSAEQATPAGLDG